MELEKEYYGITEAAEMLHLSTSLLRYWENEFPQIKPYKNKKGDRYFTKKDIETIQTIYYLTKIQGFTLQGAKLELSNNPGKHTSKARALLALHTIRGHLLEIKENLD